MQTITKLKSPKLHFLSGDKNWLQYGGKFITKKYNFNDLDVYFVIELINLLDIFGDKSQPQYDLSISAVAPSQISAETMKHIKEVHYTEPLIEALHSYGACAHLWSNSGNNFKALWREAHEELKAITNSFEFYMDKPENEVGNNGWDFINGEKY